VCTATGGERSFTTVAFLLSVGANTESPFRVMDEYDVFMDGINRRVATETLLEFAHDQAEYQFIFLTPQDLAVSPRRGGVAVVVAALT
jgi:chromosome segregation ATPase